MKHDEKLRSGSARTDPINRWSLDSELQLMAGADSLALSLRSLGLADEDQSIPTVKILQDWHRGGAECYIFVFSLEYQESESRVLILKACVNVGVASISLTVGDWLNRRSKISEFGSRTPRLYGVNGGTILEEFVPYTITDALKQPRHRANLIQAIGRTAAQLCLAGFAGNSPHDWRSSGEDVVLIDFGQDVGIKKYNGADHPPEILVQVAELAERHGTPMNEREQRAMLHAFEKVARARLQN